MSSFFKRFVLCACTLSVAIAGAASSQAACFQKVGGVPGAYAQPPAWWAPGASPLGEPGTRWIDDPRWQGASALTTTFDHARFRGLVETVGTDRFLVLMWHVRPAPGGTVNPTDDRLYFGFSDDTLGTRQAFEIRPAATTATEGSTAYSAFYYNWNAATSEWEEIAFPPSWVTDTGRLDVFCGAECDEWAFRIRVPLTASVSATDVPVTPGGNFKFFYQVRENNPGGAALYSFPQGFADVTSKSECAIGPFCISIPSTWGAFTDSPTCAGDISLLPSHIYVGTPGNHQISLTAPNDIHARPVNNSSGPRNGDSIRAKFRLANWGSTIGASPSWAPLACAGVDAEGYVTGNAGVVGTTAPGNQFDVRCTWTVPAADVCKYKPAGDPCGPEAGERHWDQCVLAELASVIGNPQPYYYSPQSAWRNLQFTGASKVVKDAMLDIRGLAPGDPARDVYVYVQTRNMPERVTDETPTPLQRLGKELSTKLRRAQVVLPEGRSVGKDTAAQIQGALAAGLLTDADVETLMPTYTAYVWHDSGKTMLGRKVLTPQPSFGYVVWHDGELEGWRHSLEGQGSSVTEISPNFYKVSVPKGGVATVTTTIEALEEAPTDCHCADCAPRDHEHLQVPPHRHCLCSTPGAGPGGWTMFGLPLLLAATALVRRRRLLL